MRYMYSSNFGCLIVILIMFIVLSFLGLVSRLIFATPLGVLLLLGVGVWYLLKGRESRNKKEAEFENFEDETTWESTAYNSEMDKTNMKKPSRDADDVDYTDVDE